MTITLYKVIIIVFLCYFSSYDNTNYDIILIMVIWMCG